MAEPRCSRRRVLAAGVATGTLLAVGPAMLGGCTAAPPALPEEPDPLASPATRAESDVALAQAVAARHPALAAAAVALAMDRQAHATALRAELHQAGAGTVPSSSVPSSSVPPTARDTAMTRQGDARDALAEAIRGARDEAAALVATLPGYRAALLASVAACCASHAVVLPVLA